MKHGITLLAVVSVIALSLSGCVAIPLAAVSALGVAGVAVSGVGVTMAVGQATHPAVTDDVEGTVRLHHAVSGQRFRTMAGWAAARMGYRVVKTASNGNTVGVLLMKESGFANAMKGGDWRFQIALNLTRGSRIVRVHAHAWGNYGSVSQGVTAEGMFRSLRHNLRSAPS